MSQVAPASKPWGIDDLRQRLGGDSQIAFMSERESVVVVHISIAMERHVDPLKALATLHR